MPVLLHMVWNAPFPFPLYGKYILVGVVGWFICLSLVQEGLHEIAAEQSEARDRPAHEGDDDSARNNEEGGAQ